MCRVELLPYLARMGFEGSALNSSAEMLPVAPEIVGSKPSSLADEEALEVKHFRSEFDSNLQDKRLSMAGIHDATMPEWLADFLGAE